MVSCSRYANNAIPGEYRKIAEKLFPPDGYPDGEGPSLDHIFGFSKILGLGADYKEILAIPNTAADLGHLLHSFQNNLDLLIQKTWVEKADEIRKEDLLDRIPQFIDSIKEEKYLEALAEFGAILDELAWLFFGAQSGREDFTEYTMRIDTQLGLFLWYGGQLCSGETSEWIKRTDKENLKAILLLGICYLTNF